ncbi:MAG: hypothetical protein ACP5JU_03910, partial [Minisyncoccia bacterium]
AIKGNSKTAAENDLLNNKKEEEKVLNILKNEDTKLFHSIDFLPYDEEIYENEPDVTPILNQNNSDFIKKIDEIFKKILKAHNF